MRKYKRQMEQAKQKAENTQRLALEGQLPVAELIAGAREDIEAFAAKLGLKVIQATEGYCITRHTPPSLPRRSVPAKAGHPTLIVLARTRDVRG